MVLVGVHPVFTHVPPNSLRSTIATFIPASLKRPARGAPACPVPTMIASYAFIINHFAVLVPRVFGIVLRNRIDEILPQALPWSHFWLRWGQESACQNRARASCRFHFWGVSSYSEGYRVL